jgi:hypothetical protein
MTLCMKIRQILFVAHFHIRWCHPTVTWRMSLMVVLQHHSSSSVFSGVCFLCSVSWSLFVLLFWPLYCLSFFYFGHCIVCHSFILAIVLSVILLFRPLYCLSFFYFGHCIVCHSFILAIVLSVILHFPVSDYHFRIFKLSSHDLKKIPPLCLL